MKKTLISLAVAAGMAASSAAIAAPTVYGNIHLSILSFDKAANGNATMTSNTSDLGVKGSEDLGDGMKGFYKAEFQLNADGDAADNTPSKAALTQRDVYVGLKGGMGTVKFGNLSSNYKQMGGKVDALYRTPAEGRGFIATQSKLHSGTGGMNTGRMSNQVQYSSPKMGGMSMVANTTFSGSNDEAMGLGVRYETKSFSVYADYLDTAPLATSVSANATETSTKFGGKFATGAYFVGAQIEQTEDATGYDYMHLNGGYAIDKNNVVTATIGKATHINNDQQDTAGVAIAYDHKMSKMTDVYVAYVDRASNLASKEDSALALGMRVKF